MNKGICYLCNNELAENSIVYTLGKFRKEIKETFKLEEIDRLKLENCQLKIELLEKTYKELINKRNFIDKFQKELSREIESKHSINDLSDYNIDLITGSCFKIK